MQYFRSYSHKYIFKFSEANQSVVGCYKLGCTGKGQTGAWAVHFRQAGPEPKHQGHRPHLAAMQCQSLPGTAWGAAAATGLCLCCGPCSLPMLIPKFNS